MQVRVQSRRWGYTVVELMVTIVIVAVLAATIGMFFAKLLTIQEREREEAYVREKLADICGAYADMLSVGASIGTSNHVIRVKYRWETGGVSLETGRVSRVAQLTSEVNSTNRTVDLNVDAFESRKGVVRKLSRIARGDAALLPLTADIVSCTIKPIGASLSEQSEDGFGVTDAALGYLEVKAQYRVKNDDGEYETKNVTAGRVVRLWNKE